MDLAPGRGDVLGRRHTHIHTPPQVEDPKPACTRASMLRERAHRRGARGGCAARQGRQGSTGLGRIMDGSRQTWHRTGPVPRFPQHRHSPSLGRPLTLEA